MADFFHFSVIANNFVYFMVGRFPHGPLGGLALTLYLAVAACVLSFFGGLILGLLSLSPFAAVRYPTLAFINLLRSMPLLMVIFWMYFLLPALLGKIPTFDEYMKYMGEIGTKGAEIYRYLNFNQVEEYQKVADTVKLAA